MDRSNGWEACAATFIREGPETHIGVTIVTDWVNQLPHESDILDLGCGPGVPRSDPLHDRGRVYAIDASPSLARAYQNRYPGASVACEPAEESLFFEKEFDGALAWGLLFLLRPTAQEAVIRRVGNALRPGGRFLFTAPRQAATWHDNSTRRESVSLGQARYRELLGTAGLTLAATHEDEGQNHYYDAIRQ